jgi:hypothetical protein
MSPGKTYKMQFKYKTIVDSGGFPYVGWRKASTGEWRNVYALSVSSSWISEIAYISTGDNEDIEVVFGGYGPGIHSLDNIWITED